jgi:predicted nucleic acid-binding protein
MRVFLDTNVIVYAYDRAEIARHPIAVRVIDGLLAESDAVVISPQVAGEFVNTMKRKGTPTATLTVQIRGLSAFELSSPTLATISAAWALCAAHSIAWYDAIIVQTALDANCAQLFTEDLQNGRVFSGRLTVVNPFAAT